MKYISIPSRKAQPLISKKTFSGREKVCEENVFNLDDPAVDLTVHWILIFFASFAALVSETNERETVLIVLLNSAFPRIETSSAALGVLVENKN